ncbi:hypothetical protein BU16DRAFT_543508 [Lophium mytilinum]|uniref:F-box domain-containing protein n=1 Tax=Lophium mytilinum TaxID=390894 RepID=A0A6A6QDI0_9PEZI|nr:hypothetical protein BU16DRAFT_543508 [Lophium mytilinum]
MQEPPDLNEPLPRNQSPNTLADMPIKLLEFMCEHLDAPDLKHLRLVAWRFGLIAARYLKLEVALSNLPGSFKALSCIATPLTRNVKSFVYDGRCINDKLHDWVAYRESIQVRQKVSECISCWKEIDWLDSVEIHPGARVHTVDVWKYVDNEGLDAFDQPVEDSLLYLQKEFGFPIGPHTTSNAEESSEDNSMLEEFTALVKWQRDMWRNHGDSALISETLAKLHALDTIRLISRSQSGPTNGLNHSMIAPQSVLGSRQLFALLRGCHFAGTKLKVLDADNLSFRFFERVDKKMLEATNALQTLKLRLSIIDIDDRILQRSRQFSRDGLHRFLVNARNLKHLDLQFTRTFFYAGGCVAPMRFRDILQNIH